MSKKTGVKRSKTLTNLIVSYVQKMVYTKIFKKINFLVMFFLKIYLKKIKLSDFINCHIDSKFNLLQKIFI